MIRVQTVVAREKVLEYMDKTGGMAGVDLDRDVIHVAVDEHGDIVGLFAARSSMLVHEFRITSDMRRRSIAEALWNYAMGAARSAGHSEGIILIDRANDAMLRFVGEARARVYGHPDRDAVFLVEVM